MLGAPAGHAPDIFDAENQTLLAARAAHAACPSSAQEACGQALGDLILAYERLLRETRRLVRRSDRAELEMNQMNTRLQDLAAELEDRAVIVLDIDHFKRVNDSFGHPVGDRVIQGVVACLQAVVPKTAHIGRVGGEEFTVVLPRHGGAASERVAQDLRHAIEAYAFDLPDGSSVTASFGVCWGPAGSDFESAYGLADEALYVAKRGGRNQVRLATNALPSAEHVV